MAACEAAGRVVRGVARCGGQEHFYLEPMANLVWCGDNDELVTLSSTQCPQKHQKLIARALGMPCNRVVCKTKRVGGGFGGKETRAAFLNVCAAVPAFHLRRPVSLVLDRHVDMAVTGQRHAFLGEYEVGHDAEGGVLAPNAPVQQRGQLPRPLARHHGPRAVSQRRRVQDSERARLGTMLQDEPPVQHRVSRVRRTASRALRGDVDGSHRETNRSHPGIDPREEHVPRGRRVSLRPGDGVVAASRACSGTTPRGAPPAPSPLAAPPPRRSTRGTDTKKRGVAAVPVKFGISFTALFMNQAWRARALLPGRHRARHARRRGDGPGFAHQDGADGAQELGVDVDSVYVSETSTDKVPNASPTAASASSDLHGAALVDACAQINARLAPVKASWRSRVEKFRGGVRGGVFPAGGPERAHGWYVTPDLSWSWDGEQRTTVQLLLLRRGDDGGGVGRPHRRRARALRTDVCMDVGDSINPAIDVGQVEGGFVQGLGWLTLEELKIGDASRPWITPGALFTAGPGTYKIPAADDAPQEFNVTLLRDAPNPRAVASSKAVGEPPSYSPTPSSSPSRTPSSPREGTRVSRTISNSTRR